MLSHDDAHLDKTVRTYRGRDDALFAALEYKYDVAKLQQWTRREQFSRALRMGAEKGIIQRYASEHLWQPIVVWLLLNASSHVIFFVRFL